MNSSPHPTVELPWVIVGFGRVGQSLRLLADELGIPVAATWNRTRAASRQAAVASPDPCYGALPDALAHTFDAPCLVWLTVVDDAIDSVFESIHRHLSPRSIAAHTSGSVASSVLSAHTDLPCASLHPLQAISTPGAAVERFSHSLWTVEGDDRAVDYLRSLVAPAGIEPVRIQPENKVLYHASAATAANLLVSLLDAAIAMAESADLDPLTARRALVQLASSSLENLADQSPADALTGPSARGDMKTIERHRRALKALDDPSLVAIYDLLTRRALEGLAG